MYARARLGIEEQSLLCALAVGCAIAEDSIIFVIVGIDIRGRPTPCIF